jgi:hypothetical protein
MVGMFMPGTGSVRRSSQELAAAVDYRSVPHYSSENREGRRILFSGI